jgi:hypothetical protein
MLIAIGTTHLLMIIRMFPKYIIVMNINRDKGTAGTSVKSILVVDDDPDIRLICRDRLEHSGYVVGCAASRSTPLPSSRQMILMPWF